jgi:hypothetical protein
MSFSNIVPWPYILISLCYMYSSPPEYVDPTVQSTLPLHNQNSNIMTLQLHTVTILHATQIIPRPSIRDLEATIIITLCITLQLRNLTPDSGTGRIAAFRIEHQYQNISTGCRAGPVLGGMDGVEGPVRVVPPFIRVGGTADDGVLVEGEEVFV